VISSPPIDTAGQAVRPQSSPSDRVFFAIGFLCLAASVSVWLLAIRAPLWLDETGSYWQISGGFRQLWARQTISFVAYPGILWLFSEILGTSEVALRIPSVLAMLGAVGLLYRAAREIVDADLAFIAAILLSLNPIVVFAAVDVRPYAFAALAISLSIWTVLRLRRSDSLGLAALFGFSAAFIVYFQYLFAVILPALIVCFFVLHRGTRKVQARQFSIAVAAFAVAMLPVIPGLHYLFRTSGAHSYMPTPSFSDLLWTLAPGWLLPAFIVTVLAMAIRSKNGEDIHLDRRQILACTALALIPALTLYGVSVATPLQVFATRHRLVAIPGISLCWALLLSPFRSRFPRLLFCLVFVTGTVLQCWLSPTAGQHMYTWKYALQFAEKNASADNAPVVLCSDFPESDFARMPIHSAKSSDLFTQLSYYPLTVPVVPMPRSLNGEAIRVGSEFLRQASQQHERFLAVAYYPSWKTLAWLERQAAASYQVRKLGEFDQIDVLEFDPRPAH